MQNSQPYSRFADRAPQDGMRIARRARRGALMPAALLAVLLITALMSQFAQAQLRQASAARSEARAVQLALIAADFDYYVHKNRGALADTLTQASARGLVLTPAEQVIFKDVYLRAGVVYQMPGFTLTYLVGRIDDGEEVVGGFLLSASETNGASEAEMETLVVRLASYGAQDVVQQPDRFVQNVLGRALTSSERVFLTAPLSGLGTEYVLRTRRAGHAAPKLVGADPNAGTGALDLNGHDLVNVGTLTAIGGGDSAATRVVGTLHTPEMTGTLTSVGRISEDGSTASSRVAGGNVDIADTTSVTGTFTVQQSLTSGGLRILSDSTTGPMTLSGPVQTGTLRTPELRAENLATRRRITISRRATVSQSLVAETLRTPAAGVPRLTARQIFTERAEITHLQFPSGGCTGC